MAFAVAMVDDVQIIEVDSHMVKFLALVLVPEQLALGRVVRGMVFTLDGGAGQVQSEQKLDKKAVVRTIPRTRDLTLP